MTLPRTPLSRAWGALLLTLQLLNACAATLVVLGTLELPDALKSQVLSWQVYVSVAVGAIQAFTRALADEDQDGTPDIFQGRGGPPPVAGGGA